MHGHGCMKQLYFSVSQINEFLFRWKSFPSCVQLGKQMVPTITLNTWSFLSNLLKGLVNLLRIRNNLNIENNKARSLCLRSANFSRMTKMNNLPPPPHTLSFFSVFVCCLSQAVDFQKKCISYYDSLKGSNNQCLSALRWETVSVFDSVG